jgi:hypothetical protein
MRKQVKRFTAFTELGVADSENAGFVGWSLPHVSIEPLSKQMIVNRGTNRVWQMRGQRLVWLKPLFKFKNLTSLDTANTLRAALKYPLRTIEQNDGLVGVGRQRTLGCGRFPALQEN